MKQCSERVSTDSWHYKQCERDAVVERDGKAYCKQHDPEHIKELSAKREAKRKATSCPKCGSNPLAWYVYCHFCGTKYPPR